MQYLGSKARIADWITDTILWEFPNRSRIHDVMAGSGAISYAAHQRGLRIFSNDIQPYSYVVLSSTFVQSREGISNTIEYLKSSEFDKFLQSGARKAYLQLANQERELLRNNASPLNRQAYVDFASANIASPVNCTRNYDLFVSYYANTYFGVQQCLEIDAIRQLADQAEPNIGIHLKAALISAMTNLANTTTHLAQYLKPTSIKSTEKIIRQRKLSVRSWVLSSLERLADFPIAEDSLAFNQSSQDYLLSSIAHDYPGVIYADPPYFKEHYSRYYHLLDTLVLYDYPELTWNDRIGAATVGRYRSNRIRSDFGLRSKVAKAFQELIEGAKSTGSDLVMSYASTSLLQSEELLSYGSDAGYNVKVKNKELLHSGQGQINGNRPVTEYLFLFRQPKNTEL